MIVKVTQYMRPNGRQVQRTLEISDSCKKKYQEIIDCKARLTGEQLMTLQVSQTIESSDFDYDMCLTKGPDLQENKEALEKMILRFDKADFIEKECLFNQEQT